MKIVFCKGQILGPISGADEILVSYATQLHRAGHEVSVLFMIRPAANDHYYQRLIEEGVPVSWLASSMARASVSTGRKLFHKVLAAVPSARTFIRRHALRVMTNMSVRHEAMCRDFLKNSDPDVVHILTPDPSAETMIRAAHEAGYPALYQEVGIPFHPPEFFTYYEQFTSVLPLCAEVTALSPALVTECREKLPPVTSLSVLPIISDSLRYVEPTIKPDRPVTFGFAARIEWLKGPLVAMEAFGLACSVNPNLWLKVAGEGSQRNDLARKAEVVGVTGKYKYHGMYIRPDERNAFMQSIDVFVLPSYTEGTPNSIIEAMGHGKPIIATTVGGIPDMVSEESGILVAPGDAHELSQAMLKLADDPELRHRMGAAARERYLKLFSPQAVLPFLLETYRRIADQRIDPGAGTIVNEHPWANVAKAKATAQR